MGAAAGGLGQATYHVLAPAIPNRWVALHAECVLIDRLVPISIRWRNRTSANTVEYLDRDTRPSVGIHCSRWGIHQIAKCSPSSDVAFERGPS